MTIKLKYVLVFALYAVLLFTNPIVAVMAGSFSDMLMINLIVYLGYWFIFRSDHLYNSFVLVRYPSKVTYYKAYLYTEAIRAICFTLLFVITSLASRLLAVSLVPGMADAAEPISILRVVLFTFSTMVNIVILRLIEQLLAMLTKRIIGNLFYIFYITCSVMNAILVTYELYNMNLFINSQIYRTDVFNPYECVASYLIVVGTIIVLVNRLKKSSITI